MIHYEDGQIVIRVSLAESPELREFVKTIPGTRYDRDNYYWTVPAVHVREVQKAFPEQLFHHSFRDLVQEEDIRSHVRSGDSAALPPKTNRDIPPWQHQLQAYNFGSLLDATYLNMEMGTGKSRVAIDLVQNDPEMLAGRVLIVAPVSVVRDHVWEKQFAEYCQVPYEIETLYGETVKKRAERLERLWTGGSPSDFRKLRVGVINHEAIWREPMGPYLNKQGIDWLIVDESHRAKKPLGKFSKWLGNFGPANARRRLALSGTPMPHSPLDIWAQYRFLDPSVFGGNYTAFRARYANMVTIPSLPAPIVKSYKNLDEMERRMDTIMFRAGPEVLDLPPELHVDREVILENKAMTKYRQLEREFITDVEDGVVTAGNALVQLLRLQQLTSGWLRADGAPEPRLVSTAKRDELSDLIEDIDFEENIVVFARFHADLDDIQQVCDIKGRQYFEVSGRRSAIDAWRGTPGAVLGVQIQSGGVGIDLTKARYCVYYSLGFSLGDYLQSLRRVHRPGQERPVTYFHLVAKGTVDETVYKALQERRDLVEAVLEEVGR